MCNLRHVVAGGLQTCSDGEAGRVCTPDSLPDAAGTCAPNCSLEAELLPSCLKIDGNQYLLSQQKRGLAYLAKGMVCICQQS
jgi:hypothetical protein